ncbi:MAG: hypothetical protein K2N73_10250 [Lachnospiraceae bacterium]|nr:hypothetical protein [Lachnospiraceae bacterium]
MNLADKLKHKKHMVFSKRESAESMAKVLEKRGCIIECLDWDEDWFIIYREPMSE